MPTLPLLPLDHNGIAINDPLAYYKISDIDDVGDPSYYGCIAHDGGWYILKINSGANTYRYQAGRGDYPNAWASRYSLGYDYFNVIF